MKKYVGFTSVVLASSLVFGGFQSVAKADTQPSKSAIQQQQEHQTTQGERPFGGITPKGMSNEEYAQLEHNVPNPKEVSPEQYNQAINREVVRIANEHNKTIYLPDGTIKPSGSTDKLQNQNNQQPSENVENNKALPATGIKNNNDNMTLGVGLLSLILGLSMLVTRRVKN